MVEVAALVGDTARATMLSALMGGQALTANELAAYARVSKSTTSGHLTKMLGAGLLSVTQKRRNRYYRIASPLVASVPVPTFASPCGVVASKCRNHKEHYQHHDSSVAFASDVWPRDEPQAGTKRQMRYTRMLESIKAVAAIETPRRYQPRSPQDDKLRMARTCYDHWQAGWV